MQVRDGPAAVRGVAHPPRRHWPPGREGGGGGSPESEDLPCLRHSRTPRGREDSGASFVHLRRRRNRRGVHGAGLGGRCRARGSVGISGHDHHRCRQGHDPEETCAASSRSRPRRPSRSSRSAPGRRSSPSTTSPTTRRPRREPRSRASRRTSRPSPPTAPISSWPRTTRRDLSRALGRLGIPVVLHAPASNFKGAYQQIRQLGMVTGRDAAAARVVAGMKAKIGDDRQDLAIPC